MRPHVSCGIGQPSRLKPDHARGGGRGRGSACSRQLYILCCFAVVNRCVCALYLLDKCAVCCDGVTMLQADDAVSGWRYCLDVCAWKLEQMRGRTKLRLFVRPLLAGGSFRQPTAVNIEHVRSGRSSAEGVAESECIRRFELAS